MNDTFIITAYVIIDDLMNHLGHRSHVLAQVSDAELLTVAVVAAKYFNNNHERALCVMTKCGYLSATLSLSRFNRRVHALADWLELTITTLGELSAHGEAFITQLKPLPLAVVQGKGSTVRGIKMYLPRRCQSTKEIHHEQEIQKTLAYTL